MSKSAVTKPSGELTTSCNNKLQTKLKSDDSQDQLNHNKDLKLKPGSV
ncbi:hypothetical protein HYE10_03860 [Mycoplasmopsis bovis]|nr:hypothetical protein HYE10_03860 [Mycoplasmopsis bovis]